MPEATDGPAYLVVRNSEEQHSILAVGKPLPKGWQPAGFEGSKTACLEHIDAVWTDLRPLSLRRSLA
ncbi:MbtH family protein [Kribbella sp. CA-293567]|uniref:MbtH family protein n=1 Tax=Kribbella sp. CA-293567 TaxID=3002436 RepID=UPI0022DD913C|nr:MbtH family NRPS accessory protein [Kribbella sp. CA-293567]WBQ08262.1 MbtH family NRPS accessory protein [Kribbella sp. CA-293567]